MKRTKTILPLLIFGILFHCGDNPKTISKKRDDNSLMKKSNPVVYFEIPVTDMNRAIKFYKSVFHFDFDKENIDNNEMALFPFYHLAI